MAMDSPGHHLEAQLDAQRRLTEQAQYEAAQAKADRDYQVAVAERTNVQTQRDATNFAVETWRPRRLSSLAGSMVERPAFLIDPPADALDLKTIALDVDAAGHDKHVIGGRLAPVLTPIGEDVVIDLRGLFLIRLAENGIHPGFAGFVGSLRLDK